MKSLLLPGSLLFAATAALAQCPFGSVSVLANGQGCNPVFGTAPTFTVGLDVASCTLQVPVSAFSGCCNTFLVGRVLVLGDQPASVPLPQFGSGCTLLASPVILLYQPASAGDTFVLTLPASLPPLSFYAQAAAHYFTTIGLSHDFALTAGGLVSLP
jgi:hypothetical protein